MPAVNDVRLGVRNVLEIALRLAGVKRCLVLPRTATPA